MLRANVGLSRKVSRDYQSTGYSVNLDGEIGTGPDDSEAVLERVHELFNVAEEALAREIDRDQSESNIGRRDEDPRPPAGAASSGTGIGHAQPPAKPASEPPQNGKNNGSQTGNGDAATNKQVQFILTMGQRFKLAGPNLDRRIADIIGRQCGVYDLTKKEAGLVLDKLTGGANGSARSAR